MDIFWLNPMFLKTLQVPQFSVVDSRIFATFILTLTCSWTGPILLSSGFQKRKKGLHELLHVQYLNLGVEMLQKLVFVIISNCHLKHKKYSS